MPHAVLDHLVVAASRLDEGIAHVHEALGIEPIPGGRHDHMNTHNAVLRLGDATYLEVIAIDPEAGPAEAPRWFDLDGAETRAQLAAGPRLLTWVARCADLAATTEAAPWPTGPIRRMRRGALGWRIAFSADGRLVGDGLVPLLIEWDPGTGHPASRLPETGARLARLSGFHPRAEEIRESLAVVGLDQWIEFYAPRTEPRLEAEIDTPGGRRILT